MMRKIVLLFVQRFLWKKLMGGSFKSKIVSLISIFFVAFLGGSLFAMFTLKMNFIQSAWWTWGYIEYGLGFLTQIVLKYLW